jgi:hypothetical protein
LNCIGIIKALRHDGRLWIASVEFSDSHLSANKTLDVDLRFLTTFVRPKNDHLKTGNAMRRITPIQNLTKVISIRILRYSLLIILGRQCKTLTCDPGLLVKYISLMILEIDKVCFSVDIQPTWASSRLSEHSWSFPYLISDRSKLLHLLRTFLNASFVKPYSDLFEKLLRNALSDLQSDKDLPNQMYESAPNHLKFESCSGIPSLHIDRRIIENGCLGYLPVIPFDCCLEAPGVKVQHLVVKSGETAGYRFLEGDLLEISGNLIHLPTTSKLKFALIPIPNQLCDAFIRTPIGAVHILFAVLSLFFSFSAHADRTSASTFLKV